MTKRVSLKRSLDATDQQSSAKRLKSERHSGHAQNKKYSTRAIYWEEQKRLGGDFARVGKNAWPALEILQESIKGRTRRYLVAWKPHPETGEEFEPTWLASAEVADDLKETWKQETEEEFQQAAQQKKRSAIRQARNRRLVPSSSDTQRGQSHQDGDASASPPSLHSDSSVSGVEISETQRSPRIIVPPLPLDRHDYQTIESSQFKSTAPLIAYPDHSSPEIQLTISPISSSQRSRTGPVISASSLPHPVEHRFDLYIDTTQTNESRVSESSPLDSSAKSKRRSKLSQPVALSEIDIPRQIDSHPQSFQFLLDDTEVRSRKGSRSPANYHKSVELRFGFSSPTTKIASADRPSSSGPFTNTRPQSGIRLESPSREGFQESFAAESTSRETVSLPQSLRSVEVLPNILTQAIDLTSISDHQEHIMTSSAVDVGPMETTENVMFATSGHTSFDLPQDSNAMTLTIHESIEDEPTSSADNSQLMNSKANSSQESLNNEREVETVDGIMIPVRPLLGLNEFAIPLPAEGKVKSQYDEIIKLQKRAILRFISRTGSPGTSDISSKKTIERNNMQDLLQQLNNTVTHTDLGLPMHTQYSLNAEANAAYAEYAGTKFELLGYLVDSLKDKDCSFAIFAQSGSLQDLLEEYLAMKRTTIRRHERTDASPIDNATQGLSVDLLPTQSSDVVTLQRKPLFVIAFDVSFTTSNPQVRSLQDIYGNSLPILHFLVTNSSEHVERCVPETLTSNIRLKVVVRTTYLASRNLGGDITYMPEDSDQPIHGRGMDMSEFQRAVRKSPARRLFYTADVIASLAVTGELSTNWPLGSMPELRLNELDTPPKVSRAGSRTPQTRMTRQSTPVSRAATPVGRKRLLDLDGEYDHKRQRLTPVRDIAPAHALTNNVEDNLDIRKRLSALTSELASAKHALLIAEQGQATSKAKSADWEENHAGLMRRFEKQKLKVRDLQKENKNLYLSITNYKERDEALRNEKTVLRQQLADVKAELAQARQDLVSAGGDTAVLEHAKEEARSLNGKLSAAERTIKSLKEDFEFTREQYQASSKAAMDYSAEVKNLEDQVEKLKVAADDNKRSLKAMNYHTSLTMAMNKAEQFRLEVKNREAMIRKLQEDNATLKSRRGVQTRGSSIQPASSPGPRSRQASPAPTHLMPPSGSRTSVLRNER